MILITGAEKRRKVSRGPFTSRFLPLGRAIKDSDDHGIAQIGRLEHATLEAGALVPMHLHQNEEILSYLRKGTMRHEDSHGIKVPIHNKYLMMMNAGSGIHHEESIRDGDETVEMLQIFIRPRADDLEPDVQFYEPDEIYSLKSGHFINISSVAGHTIFPGSTVYSATKHAVRTLSEGLRQEVTPYGIRTTLSHPVLSRRNFSSTSVIRISRKPTKNLPVRLGLLPMPMPDW